MAAVALLDYRPGTMSARRGPKSSLRRLALAFAACSTLAGAGCSPASEARPPSRPPQASAASPPAGEAALPRLVDLGANSCIPCKAMAPILAQLRTDYSGRMLVQFIDVWKDPAAAEPYGIRVIPTQIFFAADGRELARHEGFIGREEILARWKALGVSL